VVCTGIGSRPSDELQAKCTELGIPFDVIGDAKSARMALDATAEAYKVGTTI
jgi:NAD(H)-dependent 7alpha-hydroxy-3-oxo-delta4-cholenoic acid oxidoreductase